jgi:hypothetical protein
MTRILAKRAIDATAEQNMMFQMVADEAQNSVFPWSGPRLGPV